MSAHSMIGVARRQGRWVLVAAALTVAAAATGAGPGPECALRAAAEGTFLMGVGLSDSIAARPQDWPLLLAQFNCLTPENSDVIARVSFWNLHDGQSWLNEFPWRRVNHPLLFDRAGKPKPALDAVLAALQSTPQKTQAQRLLDPATGSTGDPTGVRAFNPEV